MVPWRVGAGSLRGQLQIHICATYETFREKVQDPYLSRLLSPQVVVAEVEVGKAVIAVDQARQGCSRACLTFFRIIRSVELKPFKGRFVSSGIEPPTKTT